MRIFAAGIATETNTFSPLPTALDDFLVQRGGSHPVLHPSLDLSQVWGKQAAARGDEFVFSLNAWAEPAGITLRAAYESLRDDVLRDLQAAMPVDIVMLMLHGAMVAQGYEDCEEDILCRVRQIVGPSAVVAAELDLHCHLTAAKIAPADVIVTFKEYPHTDINERAAELFELAVAAKSGEIQPTMALFDCRMVGFYPTSRAPLRAFVDDMIRAERDDVLSISFGHGFPLSDLPYVGAKMLVVTDGNPARAAAVAREFGIRAHAMRHVIGFDSISLPMDEALTRAFASHHTPVVVADQADNVGGGAPGDSTFALRWLLDHGAQDVALATLFDPEVVKLAKKVGKGATLIVRLGGKLGPSSGDPLDVQVRVLSIVDDYMHARPQQSGEILWSPLGDVGALQCDGIDIVVSSRRCQCYSPSIFTDLGIEPHRKRVLIVKSMQHFYSAFAPIAGEVIYMSAPGAVASDPRSLPYRRLGTTQLYPWNEHPAIG